MSNHTYAEGHASLAELKAGQERWLSGQARHGHQDAARRAELATIQKPFAAILSCIDSRATPEIIFDQGLGDLFVIRSAGAIADKVVHASVEFGIHVLQAPLLVVIGHTDCGTTNAAIAHADGADPLPGHLTVFTDAVTPFVVPDTGDPKKRAWDTLTAHVKSIVKDLRGLEPLVKARVDAGQLLVVGAIYELATGKIHWLDESAA